jgi:hypothetical protein
MATYKKMTGQDIPQELVAPYEHDLHEIKREKDFQTHYAQQHGASGFRNLPPRNRMDAALQYLAKGFVSPSDINDLKQSGRQLTSDADINSFANQLWSMTGTGQYKSAWDELMNQARGMRQTPER